MQPNLDGLGFFLRPLPAVETMRPEQIKLRSFAKVNLGLHILGAREDGFHEIRTLFQNHRSP